MSETLGGEGKIRVGEVIKETFGVLGRNFVPFTVLALVLTGIPTIVLGLVQRQYVTRAINEGATTTTTLNGSLISLVGGLIFLVIAQVLQAALVHGTIADQNGRKLSIPDGLAVGLRNALPLIGITILYILALIVGFVLLIVPGVMMLVAWIVVVPVRVAEGTGVLDSFGRSAVLTRGNRWRIFGLLVIVYIISALISVVVAALGLRAASGDGVAFGTSLLILVFNVVINTLSALVTATGIAVLYVHLKRAREGIGPEGLASIFD